MGQKINPIGLRLGINRGWTHLVCKRKILESILLKILRLEIISKKYNNSGVSEIIIESLQKMYCFNTYFKARICNWKKRS